MRHRILYLSACLSALGLLCGTTSAVAQPFDDDEDPGIDDPDEGEPDPDEPEPEPDPDEPDEPDEPEPEEPEDPEDPEEEPTPSEDDAEDNAADDSADEPDSTDSDSGSEENDDEKPVEADDEQTPSEGEADSESEASASGSESVTKSGAAGSGVAAGVGVEGKPDATSAPKGVSASVDDTEEAALTVLAEKPNSGPSLTPLTLSTSTYSRLEIRENYDRLGVSSGRTLEGDWVVFRTRLGLLTNPLPISDESDVRLEFAPQASGNWGIAGTSGGVNLDLYEGFLDFRTPRVDTRIGRMAMSYGDGAVIDDQNFNQAGRAFDGALLHYKMKRGYLDAFATQVHEAHPTGSERLFGGDEFFWGLYTGVGKYIDDDFQLDAYFLGLSTVRDDTHIDPISGTTMVAEGATLFTLGARLSHEVAFLDYEFEGGIQFGEAARAFYDGGVLTAPSAFAYMIEGELGFKLTPVTRVALGGIYASGDDITDRGVTSWHPLYGTTHAFLGLSDIIGPRTNVANGYVKISRGITESLTLKIDGHVFARPEEGGRGQVGENPMAGVEVDTQLVQNLGKYAYARGLYALFIPSSDHYATDEIVSYGEVQVGVEF